LGNQIHNTFVVGKAMIGGTNIVDVTIGVVTKLSFQLENKLIWLKILVDQINPINYGQLYFYCYLLSPTYGVRLPLSFVFGRTGHTSIVMTFLV
jgi:hypothetical protein